MGRAVLPPRWLLGLRRSGPGVHRLDGRAEGWLQKDLGQQTLQDCRSPMPPSPRQAAVNPRLFKGPSNTPREVGLSLLGGHCSFPCFLVGTRFCWCPLRVCVSLSLVEVLYQILLSFKVRFTGDSLCLCWITRLSSRTWGLDLCNSVETSLGLLIY